MWERIREEYETTDVTMKALAEKYDVSPGTVRSRKHREKWEKRNATGKKKATQRKKASLQKQNKPLDSPGANKEKNICGAKAKQTGGPCRRPAGWGTSHPGTGKCKLHGGCSTGPKDATGNKNARTHGVYETIIRDRLTESEKAVFDAISDDSNMSQEIRILRFKLLRLLEPIEKQVAMGTELGPEIVTLEVDEVTKAYAIEKLVDGIRKIVKDTKDIKTPEEGVTIVDDIT
jgi:transposase-like protein